MNTLTAKVKSEVERLQRTKRGLKETSEVELKGIWPHTELPKKALRTARQLAGHANCARNEDVLWVVGVKENGTIEGASIDNLNKWWGDVRAFFPAGEPQPRLEASQNVTFGAKSVVGLLFSTKEAPYLCRAHQNDPRRFDVPWRDAIAETRSATRDELKRMFGPLAERPRIRVYKGAIEVDRFGGYGVYLDLQVSATNQHFSVIDGRETRAFLECAGVSSPIALQKFWDPEKPTDGYIPLAPVGFLVLSGAAFPTPTIPPPSWTVRLEISVRSEIFTYRFDVPLWRPSVQEGVWSWRVQPPSRPGT